MSKPDPKSNDLTPRSNLPDSWMGGTAQEPSRRAGPFQRGKKAKPKGETVENAAARGAIRESAYAKGGMVTRGDGCCSHGKTKGKMR